MSKGTRNFEEKDPRLMQGLRMRGVTPSLRYKPSCRGAY